MDIIYETHIEEVYLAKDGTKFHNYDACKKYEDELKMFEDGRRKVCPSCGGKKMFRGKWIEPFDNYDIGHVDGHYEYETCKTCKGKGYLEKKETWE